MREVHAVEFAQVIAYSIPATSTTKVSSLWKYLLRFESQKLSNPRGGNAVSYYLGKFDCMDFPHSTSLEIFKMSCRCQ